MFLAFTLVLLLVLKVGSHFDFFLSETEKYAHVTFFFNGGVEKQFEGETRFMVPSPKVATYDLQPEMSAEGVGAEVSQG